MKHNEIIEIMKKNNDYANWFLENFEKSGGLIYKQTAAKILNTSHTYIYSLIKSGKLKEYKYKNDKTTYVALNEIIKLKLKQNINYDK